MSLDAIIVCDHDGQRRRVNIPHPPKAYLCLSHWEGTQKTRPGSRVASKVGIWVHQWYRREPDSPLDSQPRYRYITTQRNQDAPSDLPWEPWEEKERERA